MKGSLVGGRGRETTEVSGKEQHHRWPIRNFTECRIQRYLPAHPGTSLLWGPDATNWRGILWLPPKEENKFFVNTWLFFFFPFQMECINSFQQAYQLQSPKAHVHIKKILKQDTGMFLFHWFWVSAPPTILGAILSSPQHFWHQREVSRKTIFPWTGGGPGRLGNGFRMIQAHYIYCALYFHYYYISSTSDHQALNPRGGTTVIFGRTTDDTQSTWDAHWMSHLGLGISVFPLSTHSSPYIIFLHISLSLPNCHLFQKQGLVLVPSTWDSQNPAKGPRHSRDLLNKSHKYDLDLNSIFIISHLLNSHTSN